MNWRRLATRLLLSDQQISVNEAAIVEQEILADGRVDKEELEFLQEIRKNARIVAPEFDQFFFRVLKKVVLADGGVSDAEAQWLRDLIWADNMLNRAEAEFLRELKKEARSVGPEFDKLFKECFETPEWGR